MNRTGILAVILMLSISFAITQAPIGDNGASFAESKSAQMCEADSVQAVYVCTGNVVRVVSSVPGRGSVFYKSDGRVVECPIAVPSEIGGECMQLLMPNFCPAQSVCGNSTAATQIFPGTNGSAEQTGNETYYIIPGQETSLKNDSPETIAPKPVVPVKTDAAVAAIKNELMVPTTNTGNKLDTVVSYLAYVVLFLGIVSVSLLFMMFRNSLSDEETY
jgi:hypothetical protein